MLVLKLVLRALLLKFNSKPANEAIKCNISEQLLSCVPNILKGAEQEVSEEALTQMKKDVSKILLDSLNEVFLPPEGIANNL
jgi:F420-0:gamma-glutamyl ligase-like protein